MLRELSVVDPELVRVPWGASQLEAVKELVSVAKFEVIREVERYRSAIVVFTAYRDYANRGAVYVFDPTTGFWMWVDLKDESVLWPSEDFQELKKCGFRELAIRPWQLRDAKWLVEPGSAPIRAV